MSSSSSLFMEHLFSQMSPEVYHFPDFSDMLAVGIMYSATGRSNSFVSPSLGVRMDGDIAVWRGAPGSASKDRASTKRGLETIDSLRDSEARDGIL